MTSVKKSQNFYSVRSFFLFLWLFSWCQKIRRGLPEYCATNSMVRRLHVKRNSKKEIISYNSSVLKFNSGRFPPKEFLVGQFKIISHNDGCCEEPLCKSCQFFMCVCSKHIVKGFNVDGKILGKQLSQTELYATSK